MSGKIEVNTTQTADYGARNYARDSLVCVAFISFSTSLSTCRCREHRGFGCREGCGVRGRTC